MKSKTPKLLFNNTYDSGSTTFLVVPEGNEFVGVCLEFDLIVKEKSFIEAKNQISDYIGVWLENAIKHKLPEEVLNRPAPKKYWNIYRKMVENQKQKLAATETATASRNSSPFPNAIGVMTPYPAFCDVAVV